MFGKTWRLFQMMRTPVRSLVFLFWVYEFAYSLVSVFVQVFLYQKFTDLSFNIIATMFLYTGIMVGFCIPGYVASLWRVNIKYGFASSFVILAGSLFYLLNVASLQAAFLAMFLWGIGQGVFWLTVNTFELSETKDNERDFYSSMLNAGGQVLGLFGPACATALIWLSSVLHLGTFTLLFTVTPFIYLLGFLCFQGIQDYRPPRIVWADIKHFFADRKNQAAQLYTVGTGFQQILGITIVPLATLLILGTALRVGVYDTVFAVFSAFCVLLLAQYRTPSNRLLIYGLSIFGIIAATLWLGFALTFTALVGYTVIHSFLSPIKNVSSHVIDLQVMETGRKETDFYATMLLRDLFLWLWRCLGGLAFLVAAHFLESQKSLLTGGLYLLAGAFAFTYLSAVIFIKIRN